METPNLKYIHQLADGDIEFEKKIIEIIKKEFPEERKIFLKHYETNDLIETASAIHKLKHKINILGLENGVKLAEKFEANIKKGDKSLYKDFIEVLNKISLYLSS